MKNLQILLLTLFTTLHLVGQQILPVPEFSSSAFDVETKKLNKLELPSYILENPEVVPASPATAEASIYAAGNTLAEMDVSATGSITYTVPINVPPGIKDLKPALALHYNGHAGNGIAGFGWNVSGLSAITRVGPSQYYDGETNPVTFSLKDRYVLDGQRLLLKSGTYGKANSEYYTETFSNVKIKAYGTSPFGERFGPAYFIVFQTDGSRAYYGNFRNSHDKLKWAVSLLIDPQDNRINYAYKGTTVKKIDEISYGARGLSAPLNKIKFTYTLGKSKLNYIAGEAFTTSETLYSIRATAGTVSYRHYFLRHGITSLGYRLVNQIEELGYGGSKHAPITFKYDLSSGSISAERTPVVGISPGLDYEKHKAASGDFNGDGRMDLIFYNKKASKEFHLYTNITKGSGTALAQKISAGYNVSEVFPTNLIKQNNSFLPYDAITTLEENPNGIKFRNYMQEKGKIKLEYEKTWKAPTYFNQNSCNFQTARQVIPRTYVSGDFNADGITDIVAINKAYNNRTCFTTQNDGKCDPDISEPSPDKTNDPILDPCCKCNTTYHGQSALTLINLDPRESSFVKSAGSMQGTTKANDRIMAMDVNGDGKTDLVRISEGKLIAYTLNSSNKFSFLFSFSSSNIKLNRPFLLADFNGDGLVDYSYPKENNSRIWHFGIYKGHTFHQYSRDIGVWYGDGGVDRFSHRFVGEPLKDNKPTLDKLFEYHYTAGDYNGDGKADILSHHIITPVGAEKFSTEKLSLYVSSHTSDNQEIHFIPNGYLPRENNGLTKFGIPVSLNLNKKIGALEYAYLNGQNIYGYTFDKDHRIDVQLRSVTNNKVVSTFKYDIDLPYPGAGSVYSYASSATYPYAQAKQLGGIPLIRSIRRTAPGGIKQYREFWYRNATSHGKGLGFVGFETSARTNWYGTGVERIFTFSKQDFKLRGTVIKTWSSLDFNFNISNPIYETNRTFSSSIASNKRYKLSLDKTVYKDHLTGLTRTTTFTRDKYLNPTSIRTSHKDGYEQQNYSYFNNPSAVDSQYHIGRPKTLSEANSVNGNVFYSSQVYTYNKNLLTKLLKKGNGSAIMTYNYKYDAYGNIVEKDSPGHNSRWVDKFTYDSSGRFLLTSTDHLGLTTTYTYDTKSGDMLSVTNPLGIRTSYKYDRWHREIESKTINNQKTVTTYERTPDGGVKTSIDYTQGADEEIMINPMGWKITHSTLSSKNRFIAKRYEYDMAGRVIEESDPYFHGTSSTELTKKYYDAYGREISRTLPTGRIVTTSYDGLKVTVNDGVKTVMTTINTAGKVAEVTDPGGTIKYSYHGNGALKTTDYEGYKINTTIDQWGRKIKLEDPSAGTYTYKYNDIGQLLKETNPKGSTFYEYRDNGVLYEKVYDATNDSQTIEYAYDKFYRMTRMEANGFANDPSYTYVYAYNRSNQLERVTENIHGNDALATFQKKIKYDSYGRPFTETYTARYDLDGTVQITDVNHYYDSSGQLIELKDTSSNQSLWKFGDETSRGQLKKATLGNKFEQVRSYNTYGQITGITDTYKNPQSTPLDAIDLAYHFNTQRNLITARTNKLLKSGEGFQYDNLDRLTKISSPRPSEYTYGSMGRLTQNSDLGDFTYNADKRFQVKSVDWNEKNAPFYFERDRLEISYNQFKKPTEVVDRGGKERFTFKYGPTKNRTISYFGDDSEKTYQRPYIKMYSSVIPSEILYDREKKEARITTYIGGNENTASIVAIDGMDGDGLKGYYYLHRDHLGSIWAITDGNQKVIEQNTYTVWGSRFNIKFALDKNLFPNNSILGRGFTGHEHLGSTKLIHMNGRIYDQDLHRFLSPDNFIQDPYSTKSFDRFSYVWNNPLSYSDPTGEIIPLVIIVAAAVGAVAGAYLGGVQANGGTWNPLKWNWNSSSTWLGLGGGFLIGAVSGGVGGVVAAALAPVVTVGGFLGGAIIGGASGLVSGAISGGFMSFLPGGDGKFFKNAMYGAIGGAAAGFAIGGLIGGLTSKGNFFTGKKPTVSVINELKPQPANTLDEALSISADDIPTPQSAAVPKGQPAATPAQTSSTANVAHNLDGGFSAEFKNIQHLDEVIIQSKGASSVPLKGFSLQFGNNANQIHHAFRHTDALGLERTVVRSTIENHFKTVSSQIQTGKPFNQIIQISGQKIQYTAFKIGEDIINIGRIHGIK